MATGMVHVLQCQRSYQIRKLNPKKKKNWHLFIYLLIFFFLYKMTQIPIHSQLTGETAIIKQCGVNSLAEKREKRKKVYVTIFIRLVGIWGMGPLIHLMNRQI